MHGAGSYDLNVVVALAEDAARCLAYNRKRLFLEVVCGGTVIETLAKIGGLGPEPVVAERLNSRFKGIDALHQRFEFLQPLSLANSEDSVED
jgi:hypothetical protein